MKVFFYFLKTKHFASQFGFRTLILLDSFSGALADLPVGFPYRFNSSYYLVFILYVVMHFKMCNMY